jgi:hypothetical protein
MSININLYTFTPQIPQLILLSVATKGMLGFNFLWLKQLNAYALLSHYAIMDIITFRVKILFFTKAVSTICVEYISLFRFTVQRCLHFSGFASEFLTCNKDEPNNLNCQVGMKVNKGSQ